MKYKPSIYNLLVETDIPNKNFIWNTKSGAIVSFTNVEYESFLNEPREYIEDNSEPLVLQGIIVPKEMDEFNAVYFKSRQTQFNIHDRLNLIIAPTLDCNYKCQYCFEKSVTANYVMSETTIHDIESYVTKVLCNKRNIQAIDINWFGGEPLLAYERVLLPLSKGLIQISERYGVKYSAKLITNGYFLNESTVKSLVEQCKVKNFQITFDGYEESYYTRKSAPAGAYERVKNNLFVLANFIKNYDAFLDVRINVDKNNIHEAEIFANEVKRNEYYNDHIRLYLGRLRSDTQNDAFLTLREFEAANLSFNSQLGVEEKMKEPKNIWCNQYSMSSFCIGPLGEMYKCEHDFGHPNRVIGHVNDGIYFNDFFINYMEMPLHEKCKTCTIYPICLGGCPHDRFFAKEKYSCEYTEAHLKLLVKNFIIKKQKEKQNGSY